MDDFVVIDYRKTTIQDLDFIITSERHPDNKPYIGQWIKEQHQAALSNDDLLHIIIYRGEDSHPVGYAIIAGLNNKNRSLELMRLVINEKGKGNGKQSLKMIQSLAFKKLKYHRLWLDVRYNNFRAKTLYEKVGFQVEGLLRDNVMVDDHYESVYVLSILEDEYHQNN